ncbi:hypothetical protein CRG98_035914, partial [Punica granatum]
MDFPNGTSDQELLSSSPGPGRPGCLPVRPFFSEDGGYPFSWLVKLESLSPLSGRDRRGKRRAGRAWYQRRRVKAVVAVIGMLACFFIVDWLMLLRLQDHNIEIEDFEVIGNSSSSSSNSSKVPPPIK